MAPSASSSERNDVLGNRLGDDRFLVPLLHEQAELLDVRFPDPLDVLVGQRGIFRNEDLPVFLSTTSLQMTRPS